MNLFILNAVCCDQLKSTDKIFTSSCGRSRLSVGTRSMAMTTSIPSTTRPKTVCLLSSHGQGTVVMKNWEPAPVGV